MKARPVKNEIIANVKKIVNFYGENIIVGREKIANSNKRAPRPKLTNALV